jgi:hypothetical protein
MLIYSTKRLVPTDVNMLVIRAKDNIGYFYIHRALYDQAVVINDIYGEDPKMLIKAITNKDESRDDVDYFLENAPSPINIFGPFLLLVKEPLTEFEDMIGAIHVMSGPLHLRNMLKIPFEMRNMMPTFSLSIKDEYQLAWDRFFQTTLPYSVDMFHMPGISPMNGVQTTTIDQPKEEDQEPTGYEDYGIDQSALDFLMGDDDPFADFDESSSNEEITTDDDDPFAGMSDTTEQVSVPEPEPEPEPKPTPEKVSGVDALLML